MNLENFFETTIALSPAAFLVYLLLAGIVGWAIKSVMRKRWWHRFWEHGTHPHQGFSGRTHYLSETTHHHHYTPYFSSVAQQVPAEATAVKEYDDLTIIEGIGPAIAQVLLNNGIDSWKKLGETPASHIKTILNQSGDQFAMHDPTTWPQQASLAATSQWDNLKKYQDFLIGGRS